MADLISYNRDHMGHKSEIFTTCPFIRKVYQFLTLIKLYDWFFLALMLLNGSLLSFIKQANNISLFSWPTIWYWFKCGTIKCSGIIYWHRTLSNINSAWTHKNGSNQNYVQRSIPKCRLAISEWWHYNWLFSSFCVSVFPMQFSVKKYYFYKKEKILINEKLFVHWWIDK